MLLLGTEGLVQVLKHIMKNYRTVLSFIGKMMYSTKVKETKETEHYLNLAYREKVVPPLAYEKNGAS